MSKKSSKQIVDKSVKKTKKKPPISKKEEEKLKNEMSAIVKLNKEVEFYKQKINELQNRLKHALYEGAIEDKLIDAIYNKNIYIQPLTNVYTKPNKKLDTEVTVLNLSDFHFGERVSGEEMGGLNAYDMNIAQQRVEKLTEATISITDNLRHSYNLQEMRVYALGDMISGLIHTELIETADGDLIDWLYQGAELISKMLIQFAAKFKSVKFIGVVGNHGEMRRNGKKPFKRRYINWDYILYKNIEFMCQKAKNIEFIIPKSFFALDEIYNYKFLLLHGDSIRSWNSIPFYGIQRTVTRFKEILANQGKFLNYVCLGHFHNTGMLQTVSGEILLNGSLVGGTEYSLGSLTMVNDPYQLLFGVHKNKGITFRYNIKLN